MYAGTRVCVYVTGVQRGPARDTEFKFQIWSVSQGVTVCITLLAGPNSLHRRCVFVPKILPPYPPATLCARASSFSLFHPIHMHLHSDPLLFPPFIYLSRFFILFKRGRESDLIDRQKKSISVYETFKLNKCRVHATFLFLTLNTRYIYICQKKACQIMTHSLRLCLTKLAFGSRGSTHRESHISKRKISAKLYYL